MLSFERALSSQDALKGCGKLRIILTLSAPAQLMECSDEDDYVTSVAWAADGKHVAVGTSGAAVQIWDAARGRQVRALRGHSARVSALAWHGTTLSTGGRDSVVLNHDVRCAPPASPAVHAASGFAFATVVPPILLAAEMQPCMACSDTLINTAVHAC